MKKEETICSLLGIKQLEMAMLLGIKRSRWSMYESGQRDLPPHASILLSEMLVHVLAPETQNKGIQVTELKPSQEQLESRLCENQYQLLTLERKIATIVKKQQQQSRLLKLAEFLQNKNTAKMSLPSMSTVISGKAVAAAITDHSEILHEQLHRKEMLELEKQLLESKLLAFHSKR